MGCGCKVVAITTSGTSLLWSLVLLCVIIYVFSCYLTTTVADGSNSTCAPKTTAKILTNMSQAVASGLDEAHRGRSRASMGQEQGNGLKKRILRGCIRIPLNLWV
eukprot:3488487-Amphidinium_carterae.1